VALTIESLIVISRYFGLGLIRGSGGNLASCPIRASAADFSSSAPISRAFSMNSLDCSLSSRFAFFALVNVTADLSQEIKPLGAPDISLNADVRNAAVESWSFPLLVRYNNHIQILSYRNKYGVCWVSPSNWIP
jgi:hypothetical protein